MAHRLFPRGILLDEELDFENHLQKSLSALKIRLPLFEAAFAIDGAYARADVLNPVGASEWEIIEVKSAANIWEDNKKSRVKDVYTDDIAFQLFVLEQAGLKIAKCLLLSINGDYVRQGGVSAEGLFSQHDVTCESRAKLPMVEGNIRGMIEVLSARQPPVVDIGPYCKKPYDCGVIPHCWREVPRNSVFSIARIGIKAYDLWRRGIRVLEQLPSDFVLTDRQRVQVVQDREGAPLIKRGEIGAFVDGLKHPIAFLDFETFQLAIPPFDGCRPYTQIAFQYSIHIVEGAGGDTVHREFLADQEGDPRESVLESLYKDLPEHGSIVSYNATFERSRLQALAKDFPKWQGWLTEVISRLDGADLYKPFQDLQYYHPRQYGSASIKSVLPVLTDISYDDLAIADGATAASEYLRIGEDGVSEDQKKEIRERLRRYCARDSLAMARIVEALRNLV